MRTSELSLLLNKENLNPIQSLEFNTDENPSIGNLGNQKVYDSVKALVDKRNNAVGVAPKDGTVDKTNKGAKLSDDYVVRIEGSQKFDGKQNYGQNYIKNWVSKHYSKSKNPYLNLLKDFGSIDDNGNISNQATYLTYNDLIYLRDIGVYPINRLIILRRFSSAPASPDLESISGNIKKPISTVVGWVKNDDDIFNISFNEIWKTQDKWLHDLIREIINDQFGIDIGNIFPMPGWGQSMMFSFLHSMGWTDYDGQNLPIGDANLLRTGITRETESTGLATSMNMKLETTYELKYINDIDPTIVFHQIINNLLTMGTENIKFLFKGGSNINQLKNFIQSPDIKLLIQMVSKLVNDIIDTVKTELTKISQKFKQNSEQAKNASAIKAAQTQADKDQLTINKANASQGDTTKKQDSSKFYYTDLQGDVKEVDSATKSNAQTKSASMKAKEDQATRNNQAAGNVQKSNKLDKLLNFQSTLAGGSALISLIADFANSILASTLARYKWPIQGAIAQSTGMNLTPWHITIGNPLSPIVAMNYIKVDNVDVKFSGDLLYNDLPRFIHATITISNARPLGKQEIMKFFGTKFKRTYSNNNIYFVGNQELLFDTIELFNSADSERSYVKSSSTNYVKTSTTEHNKQNNNGITKKQALAGGKKK